MTVINHECSVQFFRNDHKICIYISLEIFSKLLIEPTSPSGGSVYVAIFFDDKNHKCIELKNLCLQNKTKLSHHRANIRPRGVHFLHKLKFRYFVRQPTISSISLLSY